MSTPPREELDRHLAQGASGDEDNVAPRDEQDTPEPEAAEGDDLKATLALSKDALAALLEKVRRAPAQAAPPPDKLDEPTRPGLATDPEAPSASEKGRG